MPMSEDERYTIYMQSLYLCIGDDPAGVHTLRLLSAEPVRSDPRLVRGTAAVCHSHPLVFVI